MEILFSHSSFLHDHNEPVLFSPGNTGLLYIHVALIPSPWTRISLTMMKDEASFTWLTHYPAEGGIPGGRLFQPLNPTVEGMWDPALSVIQLCLDGQLRCSRAPRRPKLQRKGQGDVNLGGWLAAGGRYNNFLRLASNQASNELELSNLHQNHLLCQPGLMTDLQGHFIRHLLWRPVTFQPLKEKYVY